MQSAAHAIKILIIDGYNVIHRVPALRALLGSGLERARATLVARCCAWKAGHIGVQELILVFDGDPSVQWQAAVQPGVRVIFSPDRHGADALIRDLVCGAGCPADYAVVTDDREILDAVRRQSAGVMSPIAFCATPQRGATGVGTVSQSAAGNRKSGLPSSEKTLITREMARLWGAAE